MSRVLTPFSASAAVGVVAFRGYFGQNPCAFLSFVFCFLSVARSRDKLCGYGNCRPSFCAAFFSFCARIDFYAFGV